MGIERERILAADISVKVPQPRLYSFLNPSDKDSSLVLSNSNLTATGGKAGWSCARATQGQNYGIWYFETVLVFTSSDCAAGIATGTQLLTIQPGSVGSASVAVSKNGNVVKNGVTVGTLGALTSGDRIQHAVDFDSGTYYVGKNQSYIQVSLPGNPGDLIFPIVGCLATTSSVVSAFGPSNLLHPRAGANPGWSTQPDPVDLVLHLSSTMLTTPLTDDEVPGVQYDARIVGRSQDVEVERSGGCWVWGDQSVSRRGQLVCINNDGGLDVWADYIWRDAQVALFRGYVGDQREDFTIWSVCRVDSLVDTTDRRKVINLADPLAYADRAMQDQLYPATQANAQLAGKPKGIVLGAPMFCEGALLDTNPVNRAIQIHDQQSGGTFALSSIAQVYDKGDLFSGPSDPYSAHTIMLATGGGAFTTWAGTPAVPSGWTAITAFGASTDRFSNSSSACRCQSTGQLLTAMYYSTVAAQAGMRYQISFTVTAVTTAGSIIFRTARADGTANDAVFAITTSGAKTLTLDVPDAASLQIVLGTYGAVDVTIDALTVTSVQIIDWTKYSAALTYYGVTLANKPEGKVVMNPVQPSDSIIEWFNDLVANRLALPDLVYSSAGAVQGYDAASVAALHALAPYTLGDYITNPTTFLTQLRKGLDSFTGWLTCNRLGQWVVGRVDAPSVSPTLALDSTNVVDVAVRDDLAKGLTTLLAGQKNNSPHTDADIAGSVSPSLRAQLKAAFLIIRQGAAALTTDPVSPVYAQAIGAPAKETVLQVAAHVQAEANRVATTWRPARKFYDVGALMDATAADQLEPGQTVSLTWRRFGLSAGKNLLVVSVKSRFFSRRVDLTLWG